MTKTKFIQMCVHLIRVQNTRHFEGALPSLVGCFKPLSKRLVFCSLISGHLNKLCRNQSIICIVKYLLMTKMPTFLFYFKMYIPKSPQNLAKFTLIIKLIFTIYDKVYIAHETSAF